MLRGKSCTARRNDCLESRLIDLREIEVALDEHGKLPASDGVLTEIQPVQGAALRIDRRFRRVEVLRLLVGVDGATAERDRGARIPADWNHQSVAEPIDRLPADAELALFRVVQESLSNVRRHSGSDTASIRLERKSDEIYLEIQDKGSGLGTSKDEGSVDPEELIDMGVGIPGMQQRLRQLGGRLEISSNSEGTTITAVVPIANRTALAASGSSASS